MKPRRGELTKISSLFVKYQATLRPPQASVERVVCTAVNEVVGCALTPERVRYTVANKTIYITAPSVLKQEIRLLIPDILEVVRRDIPTASQIVIL